MTHDTTQLSPVARAVLGRRISVGAAASSSLRPLRPLRPAFTMIELIVVMVIIMILATLATWGVRSMMDNSRTIATRIILQNGDGLYDEWKRAAVAQAREASQTWSPDVVPVDLARNATESPTEGDREGKAVRLTRGMMFRLLQSSAVKKIAGNMQTDSFFTFDEPSYFTGLPTYSASSPDYSKPDIALGYECKATAGTYYYVCFGTHASPAPANTEPRVGDQSGNYWLQTNRDTPVLFDAWRNPVLFVPSCGFVFGDAAPYSILTSAGTFVLPNAAGNNPAWTDGRSYADGDTVTHYGSNARWRVYRCINGHGANLTNAPGNLTGHWTEVPTQPFFASAGPDGVFYRPNAGDNSGMADNIYSFNR